MISTETTKCFSPNRRKLRMDFQKSLAGLGFLRAEICFYFHDRKRALCFLYYARNLRPFPLTPTPPLSFHSWSIPQVTVLSQGLSPRLINEQDAALAQNEKRPIQPLFLLSYHCVPCLSVRLLKERKGKVNL